MRSRITWLFLPVLLFALLLAGCVAPVSDGGASDGEAALPTVSVANKGFAEQFVLGEVYALLLEDAGFTVETSKLIGQRTKALYLVARKTNERQSPDGPGADA